MRINSAQYIPGSRVMKDEDILQEIRSNSAPIFKGDLDRTLNSVKFMLQQGGCKTRYWLADDQTPIALLTRAAQAALDESGYDKKDIELVMFTGMGRGFLEPGDSYFVANALGMENAHCFDIVDACMSWSRAADIANTFFKSGKYRNAMIVNAEKFFGEAGLGYPSSYALKGVEEIPYCFASWVGSEGASATILSHDPDNEWEFHFTSFNSNADLCTIPLKGWRGRCHPTGRMGHNGEGAFTAWGSAMFTKGGPYMTDILTRLKPHYQDLKAVFCHTGGPATEFHKLAKAAGADHLVKYIYPEFGNVGSASIPASISEFEKRGEIKRGDRLGGWIGSSGFSFVAYTFIY
ncbi:MAG TPA: 3-oxoacyl-ACP reductase [Fibrobacteria bacterium]|nr:3-oxoacyl-ACP reductase [Fibrobacteria bacterium]